MGIKKTLLLMRELKLLLFFCLLTFAVSCGQQKKYVEYKVGKGETMRSIARKLDIKTKDLRRLNPDVKRRPSPNTIIIVPNTKLAATATDQKEIFRAKQLESIVALVETDSIALDAADDVKKFLIHEVNKGDTFYNLTRFYNVSQEALISLNPELSEGLKLFQKIKVKRIKENAKEAVVYNDEIGEDISLKVALLLPFRISEYETVSADDIFENSRLANYVTDFYLGAELAIDSLRLQGVAIELNVYDTERNSSEIRTILEENDLNQNDVIIGPLYSEEAVIVANEIDVPLVFPVYSKNQSKFKSSRIIKTAPDKGVFSDAMAAHIKEVYVEGTITVVSDGNPESDFHALKMSEILQDIDSLNEVHVLKAIDGYIEKERFLEVFKQLTNNWVVLATSDNVVVSDAINSLISLPDSITAKVFSMDKGKAFDKIDDNKLAKIGFTYVNDRFVDEDSEATKIFNKQYVAKNNTLPSFYATKGFDITYDVLVRLASGESLKETFKKGASYRVESKFNYSKQLFETTENKGLFILQYNEDLTLTRLK
jgi:LysM repeat protein